MSLGIGRPSGRGALGRFARNQGCLRVTRKVAADVAPASSAVALRTCPAEPAVEFFPPTGPSELPPTLVHPLPPQSPFPRKQGLRPRPPQRPRSPYPQKQGLSGRPPPQPEQKPRLESRRLPRVRSS